jgi:dienelactone hydrolase
MVLVKNMFVERILPGSIVRKLSEEEITQHGFHNDTTPRYDDAAAQLAWQRTLDFFNKYLR